MTNTSLDDAMSSTFGIQQAWQNGEISRFEIVENFVNNFLSVENRLLTGVFERVHVLVTTAKGGLTIGQANSTSELKDLLIKTTYM